MPVNANAEAALRFLELCPNAKLFPSLWGRSHSPLVPWSTDASGDPERVQQWAQRWPHAYFCVATAQSGIVVVDVDDKHEKRGSDTLLDLALEHGALPATLKARTPSGGYHYVFTGEAATGANKLGQGVDLPVMIPVPGSTVDGKGRYEVLSEAPLSALPGWVPVLAGQRKERSVDAGTPLVDWDIDHNVEAAIRYLENQAPYAELGNGSNDTTFALIGRLKDFGISPEKAHELLLEHWNEIKSSPPWPADKLWRLVQNAYKYGLNPPGISTPDVMFAGTPTLLKGMINASDVQEHKIPPRKPVLGSRYYTNYVTETIAEGGGGKSTLTMIEAAAICSGRKLTNAEVYQRGAVAVINLEDPIDELERKAVAIRKHFRIPDQSLNGMFLLSGYGKNFHLVGPSDRQGQMQENGPLIKMLTDFIRENNVKLLTIDPLVKCHGLNENDNMAMDRVMVVLARIAEQANCAIGVVHHVRKPASGGAESAGDMHIGRGASSVAAAARVVHTLGIMSVKAAKECGVNEYERRWYVRLDDAKGNFSPPAEREEWFKRVGVQLSNGDYVGVLEPVEFDRRVTCEGDVTTLIDFLEETGAECITLAKLTTSMNEAGMTTPTGGASISSLRRYITTILQMSPDRLGSYAVVRDGREVTFIRDTPSPPTPAKCA